MTDAWRFAYPVPATEWTLVAQGAEPFGLSPVVTVYSASTGDMVFPVVSVRSAHEIAVWLPSHRPVRPSRLGRAAQRWGLLAPLPAVEPEPISVRIVVQAS